MEDFSTRLNVAIENAQISPAELSRRTGIGEGAISCYRNGAYKAGQKNIHKLALALGVSIPWLMGLDVDMQPTLTEKKQVLIERVNQMDTEELDRLSRILDALEGK